MAPRPSPAAAASTRARARHARTCASTRTTSKSTRTRRRRWSSANERRLTLRVRALVLAAGLGTRLRPLTGDMPKPLLPVLGQPILGYTLRRLAAAGCEAAAVNLHHRGEQIRRALGDDFAGLPLTWSEESHLLGTLGALQPLAGFFAAADLVLIVNGDSLCRWPLAELVRRHRENGAPATLLLAAR
ncbi:MAG: nucleotidyltransferase family protein, partial [Acidobacteria bacterium]|nr:nucleotidyltransferase family protein [Acidobacteriota bacterium]